MNIYEIRSFSDSDDLVFSSKTKVWTNISSDNSLTSFDNVDSNTIFVEKNNYNVNFALELYDDLRVKAIELFLYELILNGDIKKVREILEKLPELPSPLIKKWNKAFCRESIKKSGKSSLKHGEINKEKKLIENQLKNFLSGWVAINDGTVVGWRTDLKSLKDDLEKEKNIKSVTFLKI